MQPLFPLTIHFADGRQRTFTTPAGLASTLEWFDTDDPSDAITDEHGTVVDAQHRPVRLKIEALEIVRCELIEPVPAQLHPQHIAA